jgi:hypothetical protein
MVYSSNLAIRSLHTGGFLAVTPSNMYPECSPKDQYQLSSSTDEDHREPTARAVLKLERVLPETAPADESLRFGESIYILVNLPGAPGPVTAISYRCT